MKKLVTAADVRLWSEKKEHKVFIEPNTIITPAAKDAANDFGISFITSLIDGKPNEEFTKNCIHEVNCSQQITETNAISPLAPTIIAQIVREVLDSLVFQKIPFQLEQEIDPCGLRLFKGCSELVDAPKNKQQKIWEKEIITNNKNSGYSAGFMTISDTYCSVEPNSDQLFYIIDGSMEFSLNQRKYQGNSGDVVLIPQNCKVCYIARDKVKIFFVRFPEKFPGTC